MTTDDEFMEGVRRNLQRSKLIYGIIFALSLLGLVAMALLFFQIHEILADIAPDRASFEKSSMIGMIIGGGLGVTFLLACHGFFSALFRFLGFGYTERLMRLSVHYYDECKQPDNIRQEGKERQAWLT